MSRLGRSQPVQPIVAATARAALASGGTIKDLGSPAISSTATVTAAIVRVRALTPVSVSSTGTVTAAVVRARALTPITVASTATVTGLVVRTRVLTASQMTALTTVTAAVTTTGGIVVTGDSDQQIPKMTLAMRPH